MATSIEQILSYVPLTKMVETVTSGIPKVLPDAFWNLKENVIGDTGAHVVTTGERRVARVNPYGAPARQSGKRDIGVKNFKLLASNEAQKFSDELFKIYREWETYKPQPHRALELLALQAKYFKTKFDNLRLAAVTSLMAFNGKIFFDSDGYMATSAQTNGLTIDMGVTTSSNVLTVSASWASASTDIVTYVNNLKTSARQISGRPPKYAFYGKNVMNYISNNTSMQAYLARNAVLNDRLITSGQIPKGVLDLEWIPVQDAFFADVSDAVVEMFPADKVVFAPEIDRDVYTLYEGTTLFSPSFEPMQGASSDAALRGIKEVQGMGSYCKVSDEPVCIWHHMFDCFLPYLKVPNSFFFVDVTP